jgi:hypothetical protein
MWRSPHIKAVFDSQQTFARLLVAGKLDKRSSLRLYLKWLRVLGWHNLSCSSSCRSPIPPGSRRKDRLRRVFMCRKTHKPDMSFQTVGPEMLDPRW